MSFLQNIFFVLILPILLGQIFIYSLNTKKLIPMPVALALAYGLGTGFITHWMLFLSTIHIRFHILSITILPCILIFILFKLTSRQRTSTKKNISPTSQKQTFNPFNIFLKFFILLNVAYVFWRTFNIPVSTWDTISTHAFIAKIIFFEKSLEYYPQFPHNTYPLHIPLLQSWVTINLGQWDNQVIMTIFPFYFSAMLIIIYYFLKNYVKTPWALGGLALLCSSNFLIYHATISYRDMPMAYYNCATIILLLWWMKDKEDAFLWWAALFSGLTSFIKIEGSGYLLIHILLCSIILSSQKDLTLRNKITKAFLFIIPSSLICLFFHVYKYFRLSLGSNAHSAPKIDLDLNHIQFNLNAEFFQKAGIVLERYADNMFFSNNWGVLWLIFFLSLCQLPLIKRTKEIKTIFLSLILFFAIYFGGYLFTQHFYWIAYTDTVLSRSLLHVLPLVTILIVLINAPSPSNNNSSSKN